MTTYIIHFCSLLLVSNICLWLHCCHTTVLYLYIWLRIFIFIYDSVYTLQFLIFSEFSSLNNQTFHILVSWYWGVLKLPLSLKLLLVRLKFIRPLGKCFPGGKFPWWLFSGCFFPVGFFRVAFFLGGFFPVTELDRFFYCNIYFYWDILLSLSSKVVLRKRMILFFQGWLSLKAASYLLILVISTIRQ